MNRAEVIQSMSEKTRLAPEVCETALSALEDTIIVSAVNHETVILRDDFGAFFVQGHAKNIQAGSPRSMSKAKYSLSFRASNQLKKLLKQSDEEFLEMLRQNGRDQQAERYEKKINDHA